MQPTDPDAGYLLAYDTARKALTAVLENQGLRTTSRAGRIALIDAVTAQLDPPLGATLRTANRMRTRRNRIDNIYIASINRVSLTTVDQSSHLTAEASVRLLLERINGHTEPQQFVVTPQLVTRSTSGAVASSDARRHRAHDRRVR